MNREGVVLLKNDDENIYLIDDEEDRHLVIVYKFEDGTTKSLLFSHEEKYSNVKWIYDSCLIIYDNFLKNEENKKDALNMSIQNIEKFFEEKLVEYEISNQ